MALLKRTREQTPEPQPIAVESPSLTPDEVMTAAEAAVYLRVHEETIKRSLRVGRLPGARVGRHWRLRKSELDALLGPRKPVVSEKEEPKRRRRA